MTIVDMVCRTEDNCLVIQLTGENKWIINCASTYIITPAVAEVQGVLKGVNRQSCPVCISCD